MNPAAEGLLTIRQFSELTHTPIDTLKHYDRIDILKPAYTGENKYRYYRPEQALQLTRIIFGVRSKALLSDIKKRIQTDDPQEAIEDYKNIYEHLENSIQELKALQNSIIIWFIIMSSTKTIIWKQYFPSTCPNGLSYTPQN